MDVTTIFKKKDKTSVQNYRSGSVLPTVERIMQKKLLIILEYSSLHFCVDTEKDSAHKCFVIIKRKVDSMPI